MQSGAFKAAPGILVIGETARAHARAEEFRSAGRSAWAATTEGELRYLRDQGRVRAAVAVVELDASAHRADERRRFLASMAARSRLPVVLVGAAPAHVAEFSNVIAMFPAETEAAAIAGALATIPPDPSDEPAP